MNHLENLISQYYQWKGYIVRSNIKVGRLSHGGWEGELDIVAFHPETQHLIHLEPSLDAHSWAKREKRFDKKFRCGESYIRSEIFPWVDDDIKIDHCAILNSSTNSELAGGKVLSVDEFVKLIKDDISRVGVMRSSAIPEELDLLRTIQYVVCVYSSLK